MSSMAPTTQYAKSGDVHIAYQVLGEGPMDLIFVPGFLSHLDCYSEEPSIWRFFERLASFSRLILFDKRGMGLSDRVEGATTLEERMDDVRAVLDAVGSENAAVYGTSEGVPLSLLFAATYPEPTRGLVLFAGFPRALRAPDYPSGMSEQQGAVFVETLEREWGRGSFFARLAAPSLANDPHFREWFARFERLSASPGTAVQMMLLNRQIDVRHVLPAIRVPTLILHRVGDGLMPVDASRYMAERIPGAKYIELPGKDHVPFGCEDTETTLDEVEEFLTGTKAVLEPDRILATVLFTDIVGSTQRAAELGDRRWRELLERHHGLVRKELTRFRGREVDTAGDGFLATFDGPARAIRCATSVRDRVSDLGLEIRAGLHTGECEQMGERIGGIAVHIGARVVGSAEPSEVLVSSTVKDLVAGSGIEFVDRGRHALKGVPDEWQLYSVASC